MFLTKILNVCLFLLSYDMINDSVNIAEKIDVSATTLEFDSVKLSHNGGEQYIRMEQTQKIFQNIYKICQNSFQQYPQYWTNFKSIVELIRDTIVHSV